MLIAAIIALVLAAVLFIIGRSMAAKAIVIEGAEKTTVASRRNACRSIGLFMPSARHLS